MRDFGRTPLRRQANADPKPADMSPADFCLTRH
jgi:hypothetical protein